jgi:hypothetical protein
LPVHPLHGQRVEIVACHGRHAVRVEQPDGQLRLLPITWTDLVPWPEAMAIRGRPVRLAPKAVGELTAWVAARISRDGAPEKLDGLGADASQLKLDAGPADGAVVHYHDGATLTLVGQAGPPRTGRRGGPPQRGPQ